MPRTVAQLRALESATCAYMLTIDGLPYAWVTDHPGDVLLGSGAGSYIGVYENAAAWETVGQRTVLPGLVVPDGVARGALNKKTGLFESTGADFKIIDHDGTLATLFATEAATIGKLGERIAPSQTALGASIIVDGSAIDLADYHVGIEAIGPARERRAYHHLPIQGIGLHHQVHVDAADDAIFTDQSPQPVPVTTSPLVFAGRRASLWRLYRDDSLGESYLAWPSWDQYSASEAVWHGVMRDAGEYGGDRTWRLSFYGPESLARQKIGGGENDDWMPIVQASQTLADHERGIAINLRYDQWGGTLGDEDGGVGYGFTHHYNSAGFGQASSLAGGLLPATGTITDYITAINDAIQDVADGTLGDFGTGNTLTGVTNFVDEDFDGDGMTDRQKCSVRIEGTPTKIVIRRRDQSGDFAYSGPVTLVLCLHEAVWRILGFDPGIQDGEASTDLESTRIAYEFKKHPAGDLFLLPADGEIPNITTLNTPAENYWAGWFTTARLRRPGTLYTGSPYGLDNDGAERVYDALSSHTPVILNTGDGQTISLGVSFPYLTPDPQAPTHGDDAARWFVFRGKRVVGSVADGGQIFDAEGEAVDDLEAEDEYQIALCSWSYSSSYGTIDASSGYPTLTIREWLNPRRYGIDRPPLDGDWSAHADGDYQIEVRPLISWLYSTYGLERAWAVWCQIMLSTGSATYQTAGLNAATTDTTTFFADDLSHSDWGCAIPHELVQDPADVRDAFARAAPDGDPDGAMNQVRYLYSEPPATWDVVKDTLQARALAMSLAGGRFGVVPFVQPDPGDVEYTLTEDDLYGDINNPGSIHATQLLRVTGAIDRTDLAYRWDPALSETVRERSVKARDINARTRRGDFIESQTGHGFLPVAWKSGPDGWAGEPGDWQVEWDLLWGKERAEFLAKRHFVWQAKLSRIQGQHLWPGTIVSVSDRTCIDPLGGYGFTGAIGIVVRADLADPQEHSYSVEVLIFAGQFASARHRFAPIAKVVGPYAGGANITVEADHFGHGSTSDGLRFLAPSDASASGDLFVCVLEYDRSTWTLHSGDTQRVASATGTSITLQGAFSTTFHSWTDKWLVPANYGSQNADEWPREMLQPIVLADGTYAGGSSAAQPLVSP